jgi:small subunit ribosomal protein S16
MVRIRLMRVGKKKQPTYRVVVADSRSPRDGRIIESLGHYVPRREPSEVAIDVDRAVYWLGRGAQPSNSARKLLEITGAWSAFRGDAGAPARVETPAVPRPTPAASIRATPAASVDETPEAEPHAELPEAQDQTSAAPDAPVEREASE